MTVNYSIHGWKKMKILLEIFFRLMRISLLFIFEEKIDRDARNERKEKKITENLHEIFFISYI